MARTNSHPPAPPQAESGSGPLARTGTAAGSSEYPTLSPDNPLARIATELASGLGLTLSAAARLEPPFRGRRAWASTMWRRISRGVRSPTGELVRLEALRVGRRWLTTAGALQRFYQRLTPTFPDAPTSVPAAPALAAQAAKANARAEELGY